MTNNGHPDQTDYEKAPPGLACPRCGEADFNSLVWIDDKQVRCTSCGTVYDPDRQDAAA
jgi:rubredoxin